MSVAPQPLNLSHTHKRIPSSSAAIAAKKKGRKLLSRYDNSTNAIRRSQLTASKIKSLNSAKQKQPAWLIYLIQWQRRSSWLIGGLILTSVTFYFLFSSSQQQWEQEYRKLQQLEENEYKLATVTETWQNYLAREALESESGLVPATPTKLFFLIPSSATTPLAEPQLQQSKQISSQPAPLAY